MSGLTLTPNELKNDLDFLKSVCHDPNLFLSNHFTNLRNDVNKMMQIKGNNEKDLNEKETIKKSWTQMIEKINSFEKACSQTVLSKNILDETEKQINKVEAALRNNPSDLSRINEILQSEELKILKILFLNKTMFFFNNMFEFEFDSSDKRLIVEINFVVINDELIKRKFIQALKDGTFVKRDIVDLNEDDTKMYILNSLMCNKQIDFITEFNLDYANIDDAGFRPYGLETIDDNAFRGLNNLKHIDFSNNKLTRISENVLQSLKKLEWLDLKENKLNQIDAFGYLSNLTFLNLSSNQITHLGNECFKGLNSLKELKLEHNKVRQIEEKAFFGLENLEILNLENNEISIISEKTFNGLNSLQELILKMNRLKKLKACYFGGLISLTKLDLSYCVDTALLIINGAQIEMIRENFVKLLPNLTDLNLEGNENDEIDETYESHTKTKIHSMPRIKTVSHFHHLNDFKHVGKQVKLGKFDPNLKSSTELMFQRRWSKRNAMIDSQRSNPGFNSTRSLDTHFVNINDIKHKGTQFKIGKYVSLIDLTKTEDKKFTTSLDRFATFEERFQKVFSKRLERLKPKPIATPRPLNIFELRDLHEQLIANNIR